MAKFFRSLFGTEKYEPQPVSFEDIPYPTMPGRTTEEEAIYQPAMRLTAERLTRPVSQLGDLGAALQSQLMRQYRETRAPSFYARGLGDQAGEAGLGAAVAKYAPEAYLSALGTEEDIISRRLGEAFERALPYGERERQYKFEQSKYPYHTALEKKQYQAGIEAGKAQRIAEKNRAKQEFWMKALDIGAAILTGGMGGGGTTGNINPSARAFQPETYTGRLGYTPLT